MVKAEAPAMAPGLNPDLITPFLDTMAMKGLPLGLDTTEVMTMNVLTTTNTDLMLTS